MGVVDVASVVCLPFFVRGENVIGLLHSDKLLVQRRVRWIIVRVIQLGEEGQWRKEWKKFERRPVLCFLTYSFSQALTLEFLMYPSLISFFVAEVGTPSTS